MGYMLTLKDRVFEPTFGMIDITVAEADKHNELLDEALISGLDKCDVAQGHEFYVRGQKGSQQIVTFTGKSLGDVTKVNGKLRIVRGDKWFEASEPGGNSDLVFLKRVR